MQCLCYYNHKIAQVVGFYTSNDCGMKVPLAGFWVGGIFAQVMCSKPHAWLSRQKLEYVRKQVELKQKNKNKNWSNWKIKKLRMPSLCFNPCSEELYSNMKRQTEMAEPTSFHELPTNVFVTRTLMLCGCFWSWWVHKHQHTKAI